MGTILNTNSLRSSRASGLSLMMKSRTPFIIQLPTDSPGCTLAVITAPLRFETWATVPGAVTVKTSHRFPANVGINNFLDRIPGLAASIFIRSSKQSL